MGMRMTPLVERADGRAPILLTCEHASNFVPPAYGDLGISADLLSDHVAWDIGALGLARALSQALDAPLIAAPVSRLLCDVNRALDAHDLIPTHAEGAPIPANIDVDPDERARRIAAFHDPFHEAVSRHLAQAQAAKALVAVHSFTPVLFGRRRPWHAGMLHGPDARLADPMIEALAAEPGLVIGRNEPYAPEQGVFYSMDRHAGGRATVMIEVRNDLIRDAAGQALWARRLAGAIAAALAALAPC